MPIDVDTFGLDTPQLQAINDGLQGMGRRDVQVRVTPSLANAIRDLGDEAYTVERGTGVAVARTVHTPDGWIVFIDGPAIATAPRDLLAHLTAHEVGHVMIGERQEDPLAAASIALTEGDHLIYQLGGFAVDEFRAEKAAWDAGFGRHVKDYTVDVGLALHHLNMQLMEHLHTSGITPLDLARGVFTALDHLTKQLAYAAAATLADSPGRLSSDHLGEVTHHHWLDYIDDNWNRRLELYETIPGAATPVEDSKWRRILEASMELERDLLTRAGFTVESAGQGWGFWTTLTEEKYIQRLRIGELERTVMSREGDEATGL